MHEIIGSELILCSSVFICGEIGEVLHQNPFKSHLI